MGAQRCSLLLHVPDEHELYLAAATRPRRRMCPLGIACASAKGWPARWRPRASRCWCRTSTEARNHPLIADELFTTGSFISFPLVYHGTLVGVVNLAQPGHARDLRGGGHRARAPPRPRDFPRRVRRPTSPTACWSRSVSASPAPAIQHAIRQLAMGHSLTEAEAGAAFTMVMQGEATPAQIAGLLTGLRVKGETSDEVAGAASAMRGAMLRIASDRPGDLVDTCGTGGGTVNTFNISTAAALVAAGLGVRIAKHGNRSFTHALWQCRRPRGTRHSHRGGSAGDGARAARGRHRLHVRAADASRHAPRWSGATRARRFPP